MGYFWEARREGARPGAAARESAAARRTGASLRPAVIDVGIWKRLGNVGSRELEADRACRLVAQGRRDLGERSAGGGGPMGAMGTRTDAAALRTVFLLLATVLGQVRARPRPSPRRACRLPGCAC